jgi:hypothetical protein
MVDRWTVAVDATVDEPVDDAASPGDNRSQVVDILGMTKQLSNQMRKALVQRRRGH